MTFFCPNCWRELPGMQRHCAQCGKEISAWDEKTFTDKLIQALSHPEPMTQLRAVYFLGEKRASDAVEALTRLFRQSSNPFVQSEVLEAIGKIGADSARALLVEALRYPSFIVRGEAAKALGLFRGHRVAEQALTQALKDPSSYVRERAKEALVRLQAIGAVIGE